MHDYVSACTCYKREGEGLLARQKNESLTISCMSLLLLKEKNKSFMWGQIHLVGSHIQIICIGNVNDRQTDSHIDK